MIQHTDQIGRIICLPKLPRRIVSLVPSQTELLAYLGLDEEVVGITKFCVHPGEWFRNKQRVGGTKNVQLQKVLALNPDLILANKEENVREQIEALASKVPVWVSDVNNLESALHMIAAVGELTGKGDAASRLVQEIKENFGNLNPAKSAQNTAYLIWKDPYITVGSDTFINNMLQYAGCKNVFSDKHRYPQITVQELQSKSPEVVILSSEPYPFKEKHVQELQSFLQGAQIILADGELFSWYGSRLLQAPSYFAMLCRQINEQNGNQ